MDLKARADRRVKNAIDRIVRGYKPKKVILHGSFARGDHHEGSDVDLIIIKDTQDRFADRIEKVLEFCTGEVAVQPLVYTEAELERMLAEGNSFVQTALREGVVVYEAQSSGREKPR